MLSAARSCPNAASSKRTFCVAQPQSRLLVTLKPAMQTGLLRSILTFRSSGDVWSISARRAIGHPRDAAHGLVEKRAYLYAPGTAGLIGSEAQSQHDDNQQPERDKGATEARDCPSHPPILPARGGSLNARGGS